MKLNISFSEICPTKIKVSLKSDKNNAHFTWRPIYIYHVLLNLLRMKKVSNAVKSNTLFMLCIYIAGSCRQPQTYVKPEAAITVFELLLMSGVPLETRWAIKKHWNNKFYYTVASCWLFLYDLSKRSGRRYIKSTADVSCQYTHSTADVKTNKSDNTLSKWLSRQ